MSGASTIEWTDATWNPVRGCTKISPGCRSCYAETFAERWRGIPGHAYEQGFDPRTAPDQLAAPLSWKKPRKVFVNSMSDLFHDAFSNEYIAAVFGVMAQCPQHEFQVLTKRADRLPQWFAWLASCVSRKDDWAGQVRRCARHAMEHGADGGLSAPLAYQWPLPNVILGVSVEDRKYGVPRIDVLRKVPAARRMLSCEPLLEDLGTLNLDGIHWVITGAESGNGARAMNDDWVRSIRDQCAAASVPFFFKQRVVNRKKVPLPILDGQQHAEFPGECGHVVLL